ncbi:MAG: hypothetical protein WAK01_20025, partial [Methylocystis sp.]
MQDSGGATIKSARQTDKADLGRQERVSCHSYEPRLEQDQRAKSRIEPCGAAVIEIVRTNDLVLISVIESLLA